MAELERRFGGDVHRIDYRRLFAKLPSPYMLVDTEFRYVDMNDAYLEALGRTREELIGKGVFEAFPEPGEGGRMVRASFERVLATGERDSLSLVPYEVRAPDWRGGQVELRYWSAVHQPILDEDGKVIFILQNTVDVTELQHLKTIAYGPAGAAAGEADLFQRAQEVQAANRSLQQETQDLRDLFMQAPGFVAVLSGPELVFTLANHAYLRLVGGRPVIGRRLLEALPELAGQDFERLLRQVMRDRVPHVGQATLVLLQRSPEHPLEERYVDFIYQPILNAEGVATGVFVEGSDVTESVRAHAQQRLLLDELNHRVKNSLATVQAIASQTFRSKPDPTEFRVAFEARLYALSQTHNLLTATAWRGAELEDVIMNELRPHGPEHYRVEGPRVQLSPPQALTLALVFHELATNAAKYGALSADEGCVRVSWSFSDGRLGLTWSETGGPRVRPPSRQGFGSRLIERSVRGELGGRAELDYRPDGLVCTLEAAIAEAAPPPALQAVAAGR